MYLDNSATTRPTERVLNAAHEAAVAFGNPSSLHRVGLAAEQIVTDARRAVAEALFAREDEIFFTSGGTEANNTAVLGAAQARKKRGNKIVISAVEHDSVMASAALLEAQGFSVIRVAPRPDGNMDIDDFKRAIDEQTVLVSCMAVNNETGAIFPVEELSALIKRANAPALLHIDAVQALGKREINVKALSCDLMSVSAHKIHGLKGCGALYVRKGVTIKPLLIGGHQERGFRAGTENTVGIAAFGEACRAISPKEESRALAAVKEAFLSELSHIDGVLFNSPPNGSPHILNFSVLGYRSETLLHALEEREIYVSSGSACKKGETSHVLKAQGLPKERVDSAVRLSFGKENTVGEAKEFAEALREVLASVAHTR